MRNTEAVPVPFAPLLSGAEDVADGSGRDAVRAALGPLVRAAAAYGPVEVGIRSGPGLAASVRISVRDSGPGRSGEDLVGMASRLLAATRDGEAGDTADDPDGLIHAWRVCRSLEVVTRRAEDRTGNRWVHRGHDTCELSAAVRDEPGTTFTLTLADEFADIGEADLRPFLTDLCAEAPEPVTLNGRRVNGTNAP